MSEPETSMIERVARASFEDFMDWQFGSPIQWEGHPPPNAAELDREWRDHEWDEQKEFYLRMARVAIEAMEEPTDAMLSAGDNAIASCQRGWEANAGWRAMVNAAIPASLPVGENK